MPGSEHRDAYLHHRARVIARVDEAFMHVPRPSEHCRRYFDCHGEDEGWQEYFEERSDRTALPLDIWSCGFSPREFTPEGLLYWYPAMVRHALADPFPHTSQCPNWGVLYHLAQNDDMWPRCKREQVLAIRDFLGVMREYSEAMAIRPSMRYIEQALALWDARLRAMTR